MLVVGKTDAFERRYTEKFRNFISDFGEIVKYDYDRAARDIGLHLTQKLSSGKERPSSSFCWFQLKGIMNDTMPADRYEKLETVSYSLDVSHLQFWYLQPLPTHLVIYVESVEQFLIINVSEYVADKWGAGIFKLAQKTATVHVPKDSVLDKLAFQHILNKGNVKEWQKIIGADERTAKLCQRDFNLIWHLGTTNERCVNQRVRYMEWQSKARSQFYFEEKPWEGGEWDDIREHWQSMMCLSELEDTYPYVEFMADDEQDDIGDLSYLWCGEDEDKPEFNLNNGDVIYGTEYSGEYIEYIMSVQLNKLGDLLFSWVNDLLEFGLIEITPGQSEYISVAPWHKRCV